MKFDRFQIDATEQRFREREQQRARNTRLIGEGRLLEVDTPARVEKFLARNSFSPNDTRDFLRYSGKGVPPANEFVGGIKEPYALERVLGTNDLMGVSFLEAGLKVARTVGRIWMGVVSGRPMGYGTGFLISPRLLMTNHHVLGDRNIARTSQVEFNYQLGLGGTLGPSVTFSLDPGTFHFADQHLDYAVVAIQPLSSNGQRLSEFGWNPLLESESKAIAAQWVNIIQHPNGEPKQLALRENQIVDVLDEFLHYRTDTAPGSSGSPVYNDSWEVVALHHSGVWAKNSAGQILAVDGQVWREEMGESRIKWIANEGVRISTIISHLRKQTMPEAQRRLFEECFIASVGEPQPDHEKAVRSPSGKGQSGVTVSIDRDGTATWSIPLSVSVKLGGVPSIGEFDRPGGGDGRPVFGQQPVQGDVLSRPKVVAQADDLGAVIDAAKWEFGKRSDVLDVRLGYVFKNGWITNQKALVVSVKQKRSPAALQEAKISALPESFRGIPVEVTNPTLEDLIRLARGPAVAGAALRESTVVREEIKYFPPPNAQLNSVTGKMRVIAHVSPDAGWSQLQAFLEATKERLTVGMYDFGATHIESAIEAVGAKKDFKQLTLIMQHGEDVGSGTKANDLTDDEIIQKLSKALGRKFEHAWVKKGPVNGWISSSYHIKVAVRDRTAFWLSSGNWQSSNQPNGDPLNETPKNRSWLSQYNREWHAIVEHKGLADTYEKFLLHDFAENQSYVPGEEIALPDLLLPGAFFLPSPEERAAAFQYFPPLDDSRVFTVQPLLTPDNYHEYVLRLVQSAEQEILIQNQTFNAPGENHDKLRELVSAVLEKQRAGVDVKIIFRVLFASKARQVLEGLKDFGFPMEIFKVQKGCHTKGIIVDRKRVLLGSQNWSNDGVSVNRDASLLFDDQPLAEYFGTIFDHDWNNLAKQNIGFEAMPIEWASAGDPTPSGMVRLDWKDYMEMF